MIQVAFGKRIKELRKQTGLSQEKFALKIGRNVSLKNIEKIASGFDISISQLFIGVGNKKNKEW